MVAFTAGAVLTAANLNTAFNALTFRAVTGTSDTFVLADNGGAVSYSNASPITATVPPFSSVAYANGTVIQLLNLGAGVVTVTAGVGVTLNGSSVAIAQNTGGTLIKTATNTWYFLPSSTGSGMDLITPTSVAGSGVTLSGGQVSFSAATSVSVNGCFTTAYDTYIVQTQVTALSTAAFISLRMRTAGTDNASANYYYNGMVAVSSSDSVFNSFRSAGAISSWQLFNTATDDSFAHTFISGPAQTFSTGFQNVTTGTNATDMFYGANGGRMSVSTSYDGLTLIPSAGNITGALRIYGLRNS